LLSEREAVGARRSGFAVTGYRRTGHRSPAVPGR